MHRHHSLHVRAVAAHLCHLGATCTAAGEICKLPVIVDIENTMPICQRGNRKHNSQYRTGKVFFSTKGLTLPVFLFILGFLTL